MKPVFAVMVILTIVYLGLFHQCYEAANYGGAVIVVFLMSMINHLRLLKSSWGDKND